MKLNSKAWWISAGAGTLALILMATIFIASSATQAAPETQAGQTATAFTGRWVVSTALPGGQTRETTYFLTQSGDSLSGSILNGFRMQDFTEGKVTGDEASWAVVTQNGDQQRRTEYHAKFAGDQLTITMTITVTGGTRGATPGAPAPQEFAAKRTSMNGTP